MVEASGVEYLPGVFSAYTENFVYPTGGFPAQFDMEGDLTVSTGRLVSNRPRDAFKITRGIDTITDPGAFGGPGFDNDYYFMFPKMSWSGEAILQLSFRITRSDWEIYYDQSWDGHVDDEVYFLVNGIERSRLSSAGHPWQRLRHAGAPAGDCVLTWAVRTARATTGVPEIARYLRITNLVITRGFPAADPLPKARTSFTKASSESSLTPSVALGRGASVSIVTGSSLRFAQITSGPVLMVCGSSITGSNIEAGIEGECSMTAGSSITLSSLSVGRNVTSADGGFQIGTFGRLTVQRDPDIPLNIAELIRPLIRRSLTMRPPIIINSRPMNPDFVGEAIISASANNVQLRERITPDSVLHVYPSLQPTHRWISGEALSDADGELTYWPEHPEDNTVPVVKTYNTWTLKGPAYRPTVAPYRLPNNPTPGWTRKLEYPAVYFDETRLTHLMATIPDSATIPVGPASDAGYCSTWFFVGVFNQKWSTLFDYANKSYYDGPYLDYNIQTYSQGEQTYWTDPRWYDNADTTHSLSLGTGPYKYDGGSHIWGAVRKGKGHYENSPNAVLQRRYNPTVIAVAYSGRYSILTKFGIGDLWWLTERNGYDYYLATPRQPILGADQRDRYCLGKSGVWNIPGFHSPTGTFMLSEVAMYNYAVSDVDMLSIANYLISVYGFLAPGMTEVPDQ